MGSVSRLETMLVVVMLLLTACTSLGSNHAEQPSTPGEPVHARMLPGGRENPLSYVALGDSTVVGVGASSPRNTYVSRLHDRLRSVYPPAQVTNLAVSCATSADVVRDQLRPPVALRPNLVTLTIGRHDITQGRELG